jgi:carbon-monoxide dehydrogenase small subunit
VDTVTVTVNGRQIRSRIEARTLLVHYLRDVLGLTGTHLGCDTSHCGACTVLLDGEPVKSCSMLAVQADGESIETVESLAVDGDTLNTLQQAFHVEHGVQCGYCTPGILMLVTALMRHGAGLDEAGVRRALAGNACGCTGYENIVRSIMRVLAPAGARGGGADD